MEFLNHRECINVTGKDNQKSLMSDQSETTKEEIQN